MLPAWVVQPGQLSVGVKASEQGAPDETQLLDLSARQRVEHAVYRMAFIDPPARVWGATS